MSLAGRKVLLGVSGSIAAYKAADLASQLGKMGADVHVVLTRAAAEFVGPATFRAITLNPVLTSLFDEPFEQKIAHIHLAQTADLIIIAPATADLIAKLALGIADDFLTTCLLATTAPILVAPAMNSAMLEHPATRANFETLRSRGVRIVDPGHGILACRTEGYGKLAENSEILESVSQMLPPAAGNPQLSTPNSQLKNYRVLVTAGATREPLDPVRFISNRSSGKMGFALAEAARNRGACVTVVAGTTSAPEPEGIEIIHVGTTSEMLAACETKFADCDVFIAAAAPADYAPETPNPAKRMKTGQEWTLRLRETPDIVGALAVEKGNRVVVGFAAETGDLLARATDKLMRKNLDLIVANDVTEAGAGFDVETNIATLIWPDGRIDSLPKLTKLDLATRILDAAQTILQSRR